LISTMRNDFDSWVAEVHTPRFVLMDFEFFLSYFLLSSDEVQEFYRMRNLQGKILQRRKLPSVELLELKTTNSTLLSFQSSMLKHLSDLVDRSVLPKLQHKTTSPKHCQSKPPRLEEERKYLQFRTLKTSLTKMYL
jgi:hypothetical protein